VSVNATTATRLETRQPLEYLSEAVAAAAALQAAVRLGVLHQLDAEVLSAQELADACRIDARGAERLLEALASLDLLETQDGRWRGLQPQLSGLARLVAMWDHLEVALRDGRPIMRADTADGAAAFYPEVVGNLGIMLGTAAQQAATLLPAATQVLDAGAGAAPWSLAYAARHPSCVVTAVDLPPIMPTTRRVVTDGGLERQFEFLPGDLFEVELAPARYDLAIAGNVCHLFNEATNRRLLGRLHEAMTPGGALVIADIVPDGRPLSRSVALYELGLHLRTGTGGVHRLAAYREWLAGAGFQQPEIHHLVGEFPLMLIIARKPGGRSHM
jgi:SAM-dependent methyltransferase